MMINIFSVEQFDPGHVDVATSQGIGAVRWQERQGGRLLDSGLGRRGFPMCGAIWVLFLVLH